MKSDWPVALLPARHRARHAPELLELLHASNRPAADAINLAASGALWHMEETMRNALTAAAALIAALSLFALGHALAGLQDGITELFRHWWSSAPCRARARCTARHCRPDPTPPTPGLAIRGAQGAGPPHSPVVASCCAYLAAHALGGRTAGSERG